MAEVTFDLTYGPNVVRPGKLPARARFLRMRLDSEPRYRSWSVRAMGWCLMNQVPVATAHIR